MKKKLIVVVCRGNIVRSSFAEILINREIEKRKLDEKVIAISRGMQGTIVDPKPVDFPNIVFYPNEYHNAKPTLDKLGIDESKHISKPIDIDTAKSADLILALDNKIKKGLEMLFPNMKDKIHLLSELIGKDEDFEDPEEEGVEKSTKILMDIKDTIDNGFDKLITLAGI